MIRLDASVQVFSFIDCAVNQNSSDHPNQLKFKGVLTLLDEPSTKPPNGSRGHRIMITSKVAQKLKSTLIGMGINYKPSLDAHNPQHKVGVIQKAWIEGNQLWISGIIWKRDFPDAEKALSKSNLGMSFEAADIDVEDTNADVWNLVNFHFTGATILYKNAAAYSKTSASLLASIAASAETVDNIYGGAFMKKTDNNKKSAGKKISAANGTPTNVQLLQAGQDALTKKVNRGFKAMAAAMERLAESNESLTAAILQRGVNASAAEEDESDEEVDSEDDINAAMDEEDDVEAAKKKKGGDDDDDDDDDEDDDDADDDDVDAAGSDDEDELEDMNDEGAIDEDEVPGSVNKNIQKNKGNKTTVTKQKTKSKKMPIAASAVRIQEHNERLMAQVETLKRKLRKQKTEHTVALEAAANNTDRRSAGSVTTDVRLLLEKGGIKLDSISASDEKLSIHEINAALDAGQVMDNVQRMAIKTQLARAGYTE